MIVEWTYVIDAPSFLVGLSVGVIVVLGMFLIIIGIKEINKRWIVKR
jgi:hypothetical protein